MPGVEPTLDAARDHLDTFDLGPLQQHGFKSSVDMELLPNRQQMANLILGIFATATNSFEAFEDQYGIDRDEVDSAEEMMDLAHKRSKEVVLAQVLVPDGFDVILEQMRPEGAISFTVQDVLDWDSGGGPEPTMEQYRDVAKVILAMKETMLPITKAIHSYARPSDDIDLGVFAFPAYEHYLIDLLGECDCAVSEMMRRRGVSLEEMDHYMQDARKRFRRIVDEEDPYHSNESRLSDEDPRAAEIVEEYGEDLHMN